MNQVIKIIVSVRRGYVQYATIDMMYKRNLKGIKQNLEW